MRRVAILVIAATSEAVYRHYIASYWTDFIRHTNERYPHLDVYLLNEHGADVETFRHLADNVIEDPRADLAELLPLRHHGVNVPGILSKTIHALDVLGGEYDVFFRTNLSSIVMASAFDRFVQSANALSYSGSWGWPNSLRDNLVEHDLVGPGCHVTALEDLDHHPGNTFLSGAGFFLDAATAARIVKHRHELAWSLPDDVAIGLMLDHHELLPGFSDLLLPQMPIADMVERIGHTTAGHIRLQHFPVERARGLWRYLADSPSWR